MAFNGSGVFNRLFTWAQDLINAIPVTASRMDTEMDGMATGLSLCITKDGQQTATARIPFALGMSAAAGTAAAAAYAQTNDLNTGMYFPATDEVALAAGGTKVIHVTASGAAVTGTQSVSGAATFSSTVAVTGDVTHHGQPIVPVGAVTDFAGTTEPNGWLFCYGQSLLRSAYTALFTAIGTTYGAADGTHFNLPDCRGRVIAGKDDMGGSSANRLTNQSGGLNGDTLGTTGGTETHTLTTAQLATHSHAITDPGHTHTQPVNSATVNQANPQNNYPGNLGSNIYANAPTAATFGATNANTTGITAQNNGSDAAHNNVQPTIILNMIIYTGVYAWRRLIFSIDGKSGGGSKSRNRYAAPASNDKNRIIAVVRVMKELHAVYW